ncbi:MAG: spore germination family protein [Paenibacillus sp.]|jgi:spore germination protein KB|nr:spore germination family protein [Paenibacillus sp.]
MIEKGRISAFQMAFMIYIVIVATADLTQPASTYKFAGRDMWISIILSSLIGLLTVFIICRLGKYYPKKSIIQFSGQIVGRVAGKVISFYLLFYYLYITAIITRQYAEFIVSSFFIDTPLIVVIAGMILVCAYAVYCGLEVLGRASQIIVPVTIIFWLLLVILLIKDMHPKNMFPIMEEGFAPPLIGAVIPSSWFAHPFLITFLLPHITDQNKAMKWGIISVCFSMFILAVLNLTALLIFGSVTGSLTFPVMNAVRYISVAEFLEHLESILMAIWVAGAFLKISVCYYVFVLGFAQWTNLPNYRALVLPFGLIITVFTIWIFPGVAEMSQYFTTIAPFYDLSSKLLIPILLLIIAIAVKKRREPKTPGIDSK